MLQTVASFSFPYEAQIARAMLESQGIPAVVADEHTINMQWLYSNALGGVKVQVPEMFAEQARELLQQDHSAEVVEQQGELTARCPFCGSERVEWITEGKRGAFLMFLTAHFPLWPFRRRLKCAQCGKLSN